MGPAKRMREATETLLFPSLFVFINICFQKLSGFGRANK
jgi:hypothetical protein